MLNSFQLTWTKEISYETLLRKYETTVICIKINLGIFPTHNRAVELQEVG